MTSKFNRRTFVKTTAAVGAGYWVAGGVTPARAYQSKLDKVQFGCIGVQGKGASDTADAARLGEVVAICDIDETHLGKAGESYPAAKKFKDYRNMLEEVGDSIDAVTVSTPDHTHAVAALQAMRMGKHCFCQKPLTHSIEEARLMGKVAKENQLITQMGNQGTALSTLRQSSALVQAGVIGDVQEVHVWTNRPVWPQGTDIKIEELPVPPHVNWDLWLGPAQRIPYQKGIHPFDWRGFWAFGTGALGDMACHTLNMSYMALDLRDPTSVVAETAGHNGVYYPKWSKIKFEFPERNGRPALTMFWYDGAQRPLELLSDLPKQPSDKPQDEWSHYRSAALLIGDKGKFYSPGDYGGEVRTTGAIVDGEFTQQRRIDWVAAEFERSPGHFDEFVQKINGQRQQDPTSNFPNYAGPLTETILLGNLAVWADGKTINWDAKSMEFQADVTDELQSQLQQIVRHDYHNGYDVHELTAAR